MPVSRKFKIEQIKKCVCNYNRRGLVACLFGVVLSAYAYHVELMSEDDKSFTAMCDISEHVACTKMFTSKYAKGFGILGQIFGENSVMNLSNSLLGIFYYSAVGLLCLTNNADLAALQVILSLAGVTISFYLVFIMILVMKDICVVCAATFLTNLVQTFYALKKWKRLGNTTY